MAVLSPGQASQQMKDAYEELKALAGAAAIMQDDQTILAALAIAEGRMQSAALVYIQACQGQQVQQPSPLQGRYARRPTQEEAKPYSRTDVRPPSTGVGGAVALPIPPLNTPPQAAPISRVPAQGNVATAPGLPDAVVPQNAQLHPRTVTRIQQAQGGSPPVADGAVALPSPPPAQGGDLPDIPLMGPPPGHPGAAPPTT